MIVSKQVFQKIGDLGCDELIHPGNDSCLDAILKTCPLFAAGAFYFFMPKYLFRMIQRRNKLSKKVVQNEVRAYLRSWCYGVTFGGLMVATLCVISKVAGYRYYYAAFLPGFVGGLSIFIEHPENRYFDSLVFLTMAIEAAFSNCYYFKLINYSACKETILFMIVSAILLHLLSSSKPNDIPANIWFYKPYNKFSKIDQSCSHDSTNVNNPCSSYCMNEFVKYFAIGWAFSGIRSVISQADLLVKKPFKVIFKSAFSKTNLKFGLVFGGYAGIFRVLSCALSKYNNEKDNYNAAFAGFAAGIVYYIRPTTNILASAILTILQILTKKMLPTTIKLPYMEILLMLSNGLLLHNRILALPTCPKSYSNMLKFVSRGWSERTYKAIMDVIKV